MGWSCWIVAKNKIFLWNVIRIIDFSCRLSSTIHDVICLELALLRSPFSCFSNRLLSKEIVSLHVSPLKCTSNLSHSFQECSQLRVTQLRGFILSFQKNRLERFNLGHKTSLDETTRFCYLPNLVSTLNLKFDYNFRLSKGFLIYCSNSGLEFAGFGLSGCLLA